MALNDNMQSLKGSLIDIALRGMTPAQVRRQIREQEKQLAEWKAANDDGRNNDVIENITATIEAMRGYLP